jgi:hypothetical protein
MMSIETIHIGTRKGFFIVQGTDGEARVVGEHFVGDNVVLSTTDQWCHQLNLFNLPAR